MDRTELINLYLDGFPNDTRSFAEWFVLAANEHDIITYIQNGKLISAGYIVSKPAMLFGKKTVLPYLSALTTRSEERGSGKISNVMLSAFKELFGRDVAFTALNPFSEIYYKRFGYADICYSAKLIVEGGTDFETRKATEADIPILCKIEKEQAERYDNYLIKDQSQIVRLFENFGADKIDCILLYQHGKPLAFYFGDEQNIEYFAQSREGIFASANCLKNRSYVDLSKGKDVHIQARIINAQKAILEYDYHPSINGVFSFAISDSFFPLNNKTIIVQVENTRAKICSKSQIISDHYNLDIIQLCNMMFRGGGIFSAKSCLFKDKY